MEEGTNTIRGRLFATAGARGAGLTEIVKEDGVYRAHVLGAARAPVEGTHSVADGLEAALAAANLPRSSRVVLALTEIVTRARLAAVPPASGEALRKLLALELDADDVFLSVPVGEAVEAGKSLQGHLLLAAHRGEVRAAVDALESRGMLVTAPIAFDRALLSFAKRRAGETSETLRVVALVLPSWIDLACVADGRPLFVRRVEVPPERGAPERIASLITEVQKTALVVRSRLRPPAKLSVTAVDPLGLLPSQELHAAAEEAELDLATAPFAVSVCGATGAASTGDAVRAAVVAAVEDDGGLESTTFDLPTRGARTASRRKTLAATALVALVWASGYAVRVGLHDEATRLRGALAVAIRPAAPATAGDAEERAALAQFEAEHAAALRFGAAAPSTADLLARIAAATPVDAAVEDVSIKLVDGGGGPPWIESTVMGFVRGDFAAARRSVRAFKSELFKAPGIFSIEEPDDLPADPRRPNGGDAERRLSAFSFVATFKEPR